MGNIIHSGKDTFSIAVEVFFIKEDDMILAYCPALELSTYGADDKEVQYNFEEVLDIFFEETMKNKTLEKALLELGWTLKAVPKRVYTPPSIKPKSLKKLSNRTFDVKTHTYFIPQAS